MDISNLDDLARKEWKYLQLGIREAIQKKGLSQTDFAKEVGISATTMSRFCTGKNKKMKPDYLRRVLSKLNETIESLISSGENMASVPLADNHRDNIELPGLHDLPLDDVNKLDGYELQSQMWDYCQSVQDAAESISKGVQRQIQTLCDSRNNLHDELTEINKYLDNMDDAIKVCNKNKKIVYYNKAYTKFAPDVLDNRDCRNWCIISPDKCPVDEVFETGKTHSRIIERNGKYYGINISPIPNGNKTISKTITVVRDITDAHLKKIEADRNAERLRNVVTALAGTIFVYGPDKKLIFNSNPFGSATSEDLQDLESVFRYAQKHFESTGTAQDAFSRVYKTGKPEKYTMTHNNGTRYHHEVKAIIVDGKIDAVVNIINEVQK